MFKLQNILKWSLPVLVVCACQFGSNNSTELPNELTGTLYLPGGAPANNAQVSLYPANYQPGGSASSAIVVTQTNDAGQFTFSKISSGQYNVSARVKSSSDSLYWYEDSVSLSGNGFKLLPDTLRTPGSVSGSIQMQPGDDPRTALLLVLGTNVFIAPDTGGHFTLSNMARGNYTVRILSTSDKYLPLDVSLIVRSGIHDTLTSSIVLPFKGIPTVTGLKVQYDTLNQIATLSWKRGDTSLISGYNVYGKEDNLDYVKLNSVTLGDTQFVYGLTDQDHKFQINIKTVDKNGNEGTFQNGVSFQSVGAFQLLDSVYVGLVAQDLRYGGRNLMVVADMSLQNKAKFTVVDTSLAIIKSFYADSVTALRGMDRAGRIWANTIFGEMYNNWFSAVRSYSTDGVVLKNLLDETVLQFSAVPAISIVGAKNNKAYIITKYGGTIPYRISIFDSASTSPRFFPNSSSPLLLPSTSTQFFDNGSNNSRFSLYANNSTLNTYDTLGNLLTHYSPSITPQMIFQTASENGYLLQSGGDYQITDNQLKSVGIFKAGSGGAFIDAHNRFFALDNGWIKVYKPRRHVL